MDLSEELRQRLAAQPDVHTLAWLEQRFQEVLKGYRGATHGINRALAEYEDAQKAIKEILQTMAEMERDRQADRAKIGELQARVERMAEFLNKTKGQKL